MSWFGSPCCGIYFYDTHSPGHYPAKKWIDLVQVTARARISHYSADVTLTQVFVPPYDSKPNAQISEARYSFPIYPSSSVTSFVAYVKRSGAIVKTIRGVVKTIPTAKKEYAAAVARGETAGYLDRTTDDVLTMKLGNIPQVEGTEVHVDVGYVTELKHDSEVDGIRFTVPVAIAPRYGSGGVSSTFGNHVKNGLEMEVEVDMPGPVVGIQSPSHPISVTIGSHGTAGNQNVEFDNKLAFAKLSQTSAHLENDFVLQVLCKDSASPRAILESHTDAEGRLDSASLMLTFVPKFTVPRAGSKKVRKEIIFLVDRSGSMYNKVDPLKSALRAFLKSLPSDGTKFDICSFGSTYKFLFDGAQKGSRVYSESTLQTAMEHVNSMQADMGGTEIFAPVKEACERVLRRNQEKIKRIQAGEEGEDEKAEWETELLILTDGEVWGTDQLCEYVRNQTQEWRSGVKVDGRAGIRVFTLGIGRDVSHALVEGLATAGGGYCMIVGENERFEGKVVRMLKAALSERIGGYELTFEGMEKWDGREGTTTNVDDDFEMIDSPAKAPTAKEPAAAAPATISLFDPSANPDAEPESKAPEPIPTLIPPSIIRSPHVIPPLFSFNRTTVYLLLTARTASAALPLPETVTLSATTSSGHHLTLSIPVTRLPRADSKCLHQLAVKRYLDDLKNGESWIHTARSTGQKLECTFADRTKGNVQIHKIDDDDYNEEQFDGMVKAEGERIGVKWGVLGKWTAFVALEENADKSLKPISASSDPEQINSASTPIEATLTAASASPLPLMYAYGRSSHRPTPGAPLVRQSLGMQQCSIAPTMVMSMRAGSASIASPLPPPPPPPPATSQSLSSLLATSEESYCPLIEADKVEYKRARGRARCSQDSSILMGKSKSMKGIVAYEAQSEEDEEEEDDEEAEVAKERSVVRNNADATSKLIDIQSFEGFWRLTESLISNLRSESGNAPAGLDLAKLKEVAVKSLAAIAPGLDEPTKEKILATALVLVWMDHKLAGEKDTWELVAEKGTDWLTAQLENIGVDEGVGKVFAEAKKVLGLA